MDKLPTSHDIALKQQLSHLFSPFKVHVPEKQLSTMQQVIRAIETVAALPAYQQLVLSWASETAQYDAKTPGLFLGYDFHITPTDVKLIEINTNPGGAALIGSLYEKNNFAQLWAIFLTEWQLRRGDQPLKRIAIVDESPQQQYLFPEFLLFQSWFKAQGIDTVIAAPEELTLGEKIFYQNKPIDLIYNRLTDFSLSFPQHQALRTAYFTDATVLTPHPRAHALYADKRNFCIFSDAEYLSNLGADQETIAILCAAIPKTQLIQNEKSEELWHARKKLFFKPIAGYGSKGVYRGEKITRQVFNEILHAEYVAQEYIPAAEISVLQENKHISLKYDVRNYAYKGATFAVAARLYQGQVTNFRTTDGGFAAIF